MDNIIILENIPSELKSRPQWVVWRLESREDKDNAKPSKVPYDAKTGYRASTKVHTTWSSFDDAVSAFNQGGYNGIGFVFSNDDGLFGIDIDHCLHENSPSENLEAARKICALFKNTYTEISPSGNGIRIFGRGNPVRCGKGTNLKAVELYNVTSPRYLTVTGNRSNIESSLEITDCQAQLNQLHEDFFAKSSLPVVVNQPAMSDFSPSEINVSTSNQPAMTAVVDTDEIPLPEDFDSSCDEIPSLPEDFSDDSVGPAMANESTAVTSESTAILDVDSVLNLLDRAKNSDKFKTLMNGGGTLDESAGDFALCSMIAFYSQNPTVIDTIFRRSKRANLANGKWDKKNGDSTYGLKTIDKAIKNLKATYTGSSKNNVTVHENEQIKPVGWEEKLLMKVIIHEESKVTTLIYALRGGGAAFFNMCTIMEHHPDLVGMLKFNEFSLRSTAAPCESAKLPTGEVDDNFISEMRLFLTCCLKKFSSDEITWGAQDTYAAIVRTAKKNSYHPVRDYLNSLKWDGTERISDFFSVFCGSEKNDYTIFVANSFFVSAVARVMDPGCKADSMVILEGKQGLGKSSLFNALCPDPSWFKDSAINIGTKDAYTGLIGKWIIEMSELDSLNRSEITAIKAFLTSKTDSYRPPYEKCDRDVPRQCVFVGSTNKDTYLKDETGARRFLPVKVTEIDIDGIIAVRDQLWAEAVMLYKSGMQWWVDKNNPELLAVVQDEQAQRYENDPWESTIAEWCQKQPAFTINDVAKALFISVKDLDRRTEMRIAKTLVMLGYTKEQRTINGIRAIFWVPPKNSDDIDTDKPAI